MHPYTPTIVASVLALVDIILGLLGYENPLVAYLLIPAILFLLAYGAFLNSAYLKSLLWYGTSKGTRIPLLDFYKIAQKRGWNFTENGGLDTLDFAFGLRQAASDGTVSLWGRHIQSIDDLTKWELLEPIKTRFWKDHQIDATYLCRMSTSGQVDGLKKSNSYFRTMTTPGDADQKNFADLHIDRKQAIKWLKREADNFRGTHEDSDGSW